ncbi:MAG TPA: DUF4157 domain-containing protein [Kofleriaceae bacterium]|nr:DUF4157 domain-containing protein [Kofleriaceae bacterium]
MSFTDRDRSDGFGGRPSTTSDLDRPYGERSLGATTDAPVQLDVGGLRVQLSAEAGGGESSDAVQAAADRGTRGPSTRLPHRDAIQRAFGRHDVGGVQAHVGGEAREGAEAMGATAFATGDHVAFADEPDLHTAAHEAAHVVQQRAGVQLKGGVGETGDAYERHADAVADRVVAGDSAEGLLDEMAGSGRGGGGVQRAVQMERFIGMPAKHHLHIEINQDHYKFGVDKGSRIELGKNGVYKLDQLKVARNYLVDNGLTANGGQACIDWLESECQDHEHWDEDRAYKPSWEGVEQANPHAEHILSHADERGLDRGGMENALVQARAEVLEQESPHLEAGHHYTEGTEEGDLERVLEETTLDEILAGWSGFHTTDYDHKKLAEEFKRCAKEFLREKLRDEFPLPTGKYDM